MPDDLTPEQEAVRRLLAEARHDGPTPPDVVARLDDALASLVAERSSDAPAEEAATQGAPVVDLGARRRRLAGVGLLAAAAVVVAGVAIGQGLPGTGGSDAGSSAGSAERETAYDEAPGDSSDDSDADGDAGGDAAELAPSEMKSAVPEAGTPTLMSTDTDLDDELLDLRGSATARSQQDLLPGAMNACDVGDVGRGRSIAAEVDGTPGLIVFRRPDGAAQQAEVYVCGISEPVRTLTLPAP